MKKSLFDDLDRIIEQSVHDATSKEEYLQFDQEKKVKAAGLVKKEKKKDVSEEPEVEESEDEENDVKNKSAEKSSETPKKITGDGSSVEKNNNVQNDTVPGTTTSKKLANPDEEASKNPQYTDIADKINALRGSSSLKKKNISNSVKDYAASLTTAEKSALLTYLTDLAQIMAPVKSSKEVKKPESVGLNITFKPESLPQKKAKTNDDSTKEKTDDKNDKKKSGKDSNVIVVGG